MSPLGPQWAPEEEVHRLVCEGCPPALAAEEVMRTMGRTHLVTYVSKRLRKVAFDASDAINEGVKP